MLPALVSSGREGIPAVIETMTVSEANISCYTIVNSDMERLT
jgi:hypothetical protein